jgi:hypothetical protein
MLQRVGRARQGAAGVSNMSSEGRGDVGVVVPGLPGFDLTGDSAFYTRYNFLLPLSLRI